MLGKAKGKLLVHSLAFQSQENAYNLKNSVTRGSKKCGAGVPIERAEKTLESIVGLMRYFSPKASQQRLEEGTL